MHLTDRMNLEAVPVSCDYEVRGDTVAIWNVRIAGIDMNLFPTDVQDEAISFLQIVARDHDMRRRDVAF